MQKDHGTGWEEESGKAFGVSPPMEANQPQVDLNFFKEARLFLGKDRATLTFYQDQEVASIHFDMGRGEIFYRGHNVKNLNLTEEQWLSLQKFGEFLLSEAKADAMQAYYQQCLEQVMVSHWPRGKPEFGRKKE